MLKSALYYLKKLHWSVIPIRQDKKPLVEWLKYQSELASEGEVREWWRSWPTAMVGIVTGRISGICVIDIDSFEGSENIQEFISDSLVCPTVKTPRGGQHLYFKFPEQEVRNATGVIKGTDFRGEGGYVIVPPSQNGSGGKYAWQDGCKITDLALPELPYKYINYITDYTTKYKTINTTLIGGVVGGGNVDNILTNNDKLDYQILTEGTRDNDLFHIANCMIKGGMDVECALQVLNILAQNCRPPFPEKEIPVKIDSVLKRIERKERNLAQEFRDYLCLTDGWFRLTDAYQCLTLTNRYEKKHLTVLVSKFIKSGLLEKYGKERGVYRPVKSELEYMDWENIGTDEFLVKLPMDISDYCKLYPSNVIVAAGSKSSGKTAFLLNIIKDNIKDYEMLYLNSEMGERELRIRLDLFGLPASYWKGLKALRCSADWSDYITPDKKIFLIDFLEVEEFWKVGLEITRIHNKLKEGICFIGLQKKKFRDEGHGSNLSMEKARLYLSIDYGRIKLTDVKAWRDHTKNPRGLVREFKLLHGSEFYPVTPWIEEDEMDAYKTGEMHKRQRAEFKHRGKEW